MTLLIENNAIVLFQGDSITDAGRTREDGSNLGQGYPALIAAWFSALYPERHVTFLNRGISGNRVVDLRGRWQADALALNPTWISILIGINDTWRRYDSHDPTSAQAFEADYRAILDSTRRSSQARLILMEPFLLPVPDDRTAWRDDLDPKIAVVRRLARDYGALFVPLDGVFAAASVQREMAFWLPDGVHPTPAGHALIAQAWLGAVQAL